MNWTNRINNGNYQKYSCVINSSQIKPNLKIDITENDEPEPKINDDTHSSPKLTHLRKNSHLDEDIEPPYKKQRHIIDDSDDVDQYGNLNGFVTYDDTDLPGDMDEEEKNGQIQTLDEEYEHFIATLSSSERKQLKEIEAELVTYTRENTRPLKYQIFSSKAQINVKLIMMEKFKHLSVYDKTSSEYTYELTTLNYLLKIPWGKYINLPIDIHDGPQKIQNYLLNAITFLESVTHGQAKAKSTLLLELSRYLENPSSQGFILGIKGPPGTGKTTLMSQGLAKILNRPFFRVDLGGAKHSDSLFGTRKVFERSDVGDLVKILIDAQCMNPVILFDELDKISHSEYGQELFNALNDLTDMSRNQSITDQYLGINLDFSKVIIVFAYNSSDHIQETLKSRIHEIEVEPYTFQDKLVITNKFFIPKSCEKLNFNISSIKFTDEAIKTIIDNYTYSEVGVRELERRIDEIILKINWLKLTHNNNNRELSDCYCKNMSSFRIDDTCIINKKVVNKLLKN